MALTISGLQFDLAGSRNSTMGSIAFDSSYTTGGLALTPASIGLRTIDNIDFIARSGYSFDYDYSGQKLLAYTQGAATGATAVSGTTGALMLSDAGTEGTARLQSSTISTTYKWG